MNYENLELAKKAGIAPWDDYNYDLTDFHVAVFRDRFPVTPGHLLFVPRYNNENIIRDCVDSALREGDRMVKNKECDGYNIGINMGAAAGQTVIWPHVHLIPRRLGDCADPVGGVRGVIPGQANYKNGTYINPNK